MVAHENFPLSAKLFDIFGAMPQSVAPVPLGCDADCEDDHDDDGNCLSCGRDWDSHSGHRCGDGTRYDRIVFHGLQFTLFRGSWIAGGGPAPEATQSVEDVPIVLTASRMQGTRLNLPFHA